MRARDGFHLWSNTYDAQLEDVFQIQTDVAEKVAGALSIYLDEDQREAISASGTRNVEAFQAFLKGQSLFNRVHASEPGVSLWDANEEFERAIDNARTPTERIVAQLYEEYFSRTWTRMPGLIEQLREEDSIEEAGDLDVWLTVILSLKGEFETLHNLYDYKIKTDPLRGANWSSRVAMLSAHGDFEAAEDGIKRDRAVAGDHPWLDDDELFLAIARHDKATVLALLRRPAPQGSEWRAAFLAAVEGDYERATALAEEIAAEDPWPQEQLLKVYNETGDAARLAEAGIDPARFRPMPRLSVGTEEE